MPYGMYISAEGAQAHVQRMEVIANNLANVNTPGFKPDVATFQARFAEAVEQGLVEPETGALEDVGGGVMTVEVQTDFSRGTLKRTGIPTDMAIGGEGFFLVDKGGETFLTRAGNFKLDPTGKLVTQQGYDVLSDGRAPVFIQPDLGPWHVSPEGAIVQGGVATQLALEKPESLGDLAKAAENLFSALAETQPLPPNERDVRSGYVEMSGVNPTTAMMELIETSRSIEANMKLIQNQDDMIDSLISRVLQG